MNILESIKFKNICSVGNYFVEIPLNKYKNIILTGINASGKSTVLQALTFGLYGKPFTDIKIGSLVNSINKKGLMVEIPFHNERCSYKIIRGLKPDIFEIYQNGELIPQPGNKVDYQEKLDEILQMGHKTFTNLVVLGSANHVPFMQLPTKDRRILIETLLDLEVFSVMNEFAKKNLKDVQEKIKELEQDIFKVEFLITSKEKLKEEMSILSAKKIDEHVKVIEDINTKITVLTEEKKELEQKIVDVNLKKYINGVYDLELQNSGIVRIVMKKEILNKETESKRKFLKENDTCPSCRQSLSNEYKEKMFADLVTDSLKKELTQMEKIQDKIKKIKDFLSRADGIKFQISALDSTINAQIKEITFYANEIDKLNKRTDINYDEEIKKLKLELDSLNKINENLKTERQIIEVALILLKDTGIKASIVKKYVGLINTLINEYLTKFNFFVKFELNENFEEKFKSRHIDTFSYFNFSEGEKSRINLAILFTLKEITKRKNNISSNLLAFDETLERIDEAGAVAFIKMLRETETNNIIISHDQKILNQFTSENDLVIEVKKKGRFSYYNFN